MAGIHSMLAGSGDGYLTTYLTIGADTYDYVLNTAKVANYVAGATRVVLTINPGVVVGGNAAFSVDSSWHPRDDIRIINNGSIIGAGGAGGAAIFDGYYDVSRAASYPGGVGGTALAVATGAGRPIVTITNNGTIAGGGGGGGASGANAAPEGGSVDDYVYPSGGGGGAGAPAGWPFTDLPEGFHISLYYVHARAGALWSGGAGGYREFSPGAGPIEGFRGGAGGGLGQSGQWGTGSGNRTSAQPGGAPGPAVAGSSNITWVAVGTRIGQIL